MRLPRGFSDELRGQADIVRVVSDYVSLKKRGTNYLACCPFHHEKTPSFNVNPARQIFKCFGCGKGGDVYTFVMEIEGCAFPEAVKTVAEKSGVPLPAAEESRGMEERDRQRAELRSLNEWATEFFEDSLTQAGEGQRAGEYLAARGISEETRRSFRLGYAPNSWDALSDHLLRRGASRTLIERSGLVTLKDSGRGFYDRFRGRLMFPICDAQGRVIAFGGRILGEGEPKYLNSPETLLYTKGHHLFGLSYSREAVRLKGYAILVEGYLDFLVPFQAGVRHLVASLGTALTEHQVRLLGRYARKIIVNFDPDAAGVAATKRSLEILLTEGFKVNVLTLPGDLDPDEYIRAHGAAAYGELLKNSQPFLNYIVKQATEAHDQTTPAGKVETLNAILPYLKLVKDPIEQMDHVEQIANRLRIDSRQVKEEFKRAVRTRRERVSGQAATGAVAVKPAERKLLEILLNHAPVRRRLMRDLKAEDYQSLRTAKLFERLVALERDGEEISFAALGEGLGDAGLAQDLLPELMIGDGGGETETQKFYEELEHQAGESLASLRCSLLAERQVALQMEMLEAQRAGDYALVNELLARKFELAKQERALAQPIGR